MVIKKEKVEEVRIFAALSLRLLWLPTWNHPRVDMSLKQNPSWEHNNRLALQEIFHFFWNPKVDYRAYNSEPYYYLQISSLRPQNLIFLRFILILSFHINLLPLKWALPLKFSDWNFYMHFQLLSLSGYSPSRHFGFIIIKNVEEKTKCGPFFISYVSDPNNYP